MPGSAALRVTSRTNGVAANAATSASVGYPHAPTITPESAPADAPASRA